MFFITNVQCPYCGHNNKARIELTDSRSKKEVFTCDSDDDGCDEDFALYSTFSVTAYAKPIVDELSEEVKEL